MTKFGKFFCRIWKLKPLGLQFEHVSAKRTCPSYSGGSDHDEAETQHDRLSSQESSNCKNSKKIPVSLECVCCDKTSEIKTFHLECKARHS